jgi:hypothetical protein
MSKRIDGNFADRVSKLLLRQYKREIRQARQSFINSFDVNRPAYVTQRAERHGEMASEVTQSSYEYRQALKYLGVE